MSHQILWDRPSSYVVCLAAGDRVEEPGRRRSEAPIPAAAAFRRLDRVTLGPQVNNLPHGDRRHNPIVCPTFCTSWEGSSGMAHQILWDRPSSYVVCLAAGDRVEEPGRRRSEAPIPAAAAFRRLDRVTL